MKKWPILTALVVLLAIGVPMARAWQADPPATGSAPATSESAAGDGETAAERPVESPQAAKLLGDARRRLFEAKSVKANIVQRATFGTYSFKSEGSYLAGPNFQYRMETAIELGDMEGRFLEVSDGQVIHTRRQIGKSADAADALTTAPQIDLSRRDVQAILRASQEHLDVPQAMLAAEVGIGGLSSVLASLDRSMVFDAVRSDEIDGHPVTVIQGRWSSQRRDELMAQLGELGGQLAGFLPDMVRVALDDETLFPRRFVYLKLASEERKTYRPVLTIDFVNVEFDVQLPPQAFHYVAPPGIEERDETEMFLQAITGPPPGTDETPAAPGDR